MENEKLFYIYVNILLKYWLKFNSYAIWSHLRLIHNEFINDDDKTELFINYLRYIELLEGLDLFLKISIINSSSTLRRIEFLWLREPYVYFWLNR